ncbi:MAG: hypothetical protein IRY97_02655 [Thermomicrobiaceae bacterium]|nr:hypothetical protein [Thermomicrobiaceae bacterium]
MATHDYPLSPHDAPTGSMALAPGQRRARLARWVRALRWGSLLLGAAATVAFSALAMRDGPQGQTPAASTQPAQPVQVSPPDAPSQSLFTDGASGFSLAPDLSSGGAAGFVMSRPHARSSTS